MRQYHALLCGSHLHSDHPRADAGLRLNARTTQVDSARGPYDATMQLYVDSELLPARRVGGRPSRGSDGVDMTHAARLFEQRGRQRV